MFKQWLRRLLAEDCPPDPIDHPALARMTPTELADLPLWRLDAEPDQADGQRLVAAPSNRNLCESERGSA